MQHQTLEDTSLPEYRNPKKAKRNVQMQHVELNSEATTLHVILFSSLCWPGHSCLHS